MLSLFYYNPYSSLNRIVSYSNRMEFNEFSFFNYIVLLVYMSLGLKSVYKWSNFILYNIINPS